MSEPISPAGNHHSESIHEAAAGLTDRPRISRRKVLAATMASGAGLLGWSFGIEPIWLQVAYHRLVVPNLPARWKGKRLVQLSDLHIGRTSTRLLKNAMHVTNQLEPDILAITGDFVDKRCDDFGEVDDVLKLLNPAKKATLGCLGNHDYGEGWRNVNVAKKVAETTSRYGIQMLRNEFLPLDGIDFFGLEDYLSPRFDPQPVMNQAIPAAPSICLCHNPDGYDFCDWSRFRGVILSGHTHGGQCKPPFLPPPNLPVQNPRYASGFIDLAPGQTMFISRGVGYTHRVRFNCRPEVTVFELG